ncbi:MAG: hypothetical protein KIS66_11595 [Fimbriimonadaceae bacterium]|nr:hypothetical protein [Fimbriimonadaceae bacterium]
MSGRRPSVWIRIAMATSVAPMILVGVLAYASNQETLSGDNPCCANQDACYRACATILGKHRTVPATGCKKYVPCLEQPMVHTCHPIWWQYSDCTGSSETGTSTTTFRCNEACS